MNITIYGLEKPFKLEILADGNAKYSTSEDYAIKIDEDSTLYDIMLPKGFVTDLASIPKLFWSIFPPFGNQSEPYANAAILHDYLYKQGNVFKRKTCDQIFLQAMKQTKVNGFIRYVFYFIVRLFGAENFNNN